MYIIEETYITKVDDIIEAKSLLDFIKKRKNPKTAEIFVLNKAKIKDEDTGEIISEYKRL